MREQAGGGSTRVNGGIAMLERVNTKVGAILRPKGVSWFDNVMSVCRSIESKNGYRVISACDTFGN